ncbi:MAG: OmpL47-type beta-barrel domain-containing protein [Bacteroidales bacterium]
MNAKKWILFVVVIFWEVLLCAQPLPVVEKKMYKAPDGKLYINKSLPIYLFIGTRPDAANDITRLESETTKRYANPMYFDTEGINTIQSPWCVDTVTKQVVVPKHNIIFEVYADSKPPVTRISIETKRQHVRKGKIYLSGVSKIILSATDALSGVDKIMYSLDGNSYTEYTSPIELADQKEYLLKYFAYDHVGNMEEVRTAILVVDKTAPRVSMEIKGDFYEQILAGNASIIFCIEDTLSEPENLYYTLNDGATTTYMTPIDARKLPQGEYKLTYWAEDKVGNSSDKTTFTFYVDKTPPTIIPEIMGKTYLINGKEFSSGRSLLKLTTIDNKAGTKEIYYSINNSDFKKYEKPVMLSNTGGNLIVRAYALDYVNNRSEISEGTQSASLPYVDLTGPSIGYRIEGAYLKIADTIFVNKTSAIKLFASDDESGLNEILFSIDKGEYNKYTNPFSIGADGLHQLDISASDNVDNLSSQTLIIFTDNEGPQIYALFSSPAYPSYQQESVQNIYPPYCKLFVSATDSRTSVQKMGYSLNGSPEKPLTGFLTGFNRGRNHLHIRAWDLLGNESSLKLEFFVGEPK